MDMLTGIDHGDAEEDEAFLRRLVRPEEDCRRTTMPWSGGYRWFRSPNVVDLWQHRSPADKQRIIDFMWRLEVAGWRSGEDKLATFWAGSSVRRRTSGGLMMRDGRAKPRCRRSNLRTI
jgi:hypothetical protein